MIAPLAWQGLTATEARCLADIERRANPRTDPMERFNVLHSEWVRIDNLHRFHRVSGRTPALDPHGDKLAQAERALEDERARLIAMCERMTGIGIDDLRKVIG